MEKDLLIKKYPYFGYSQNLIECFSIIGYEENSLPQIIEEFKANNNNNSFSPVILSSIISNRDYGIIDNDLIISQIFPENPSFINSNTITTNVRSGLNREIKEMTKTKNIIYSFMIDSPDGKKKLFYTCFGFIFYEIYKYYDSNNNLFNLEEYFIPKAFCIISQYSYFSLFHYICDNLYNILVENSEKMPLELIIYNIVNFIPSPINYNFNYNLFTYELEIPSYNLPQLSGYPYLDFDLTEIFNILPLNSILEIFLLTLLEQSILFFSSNLEILNMVMFIFYSLNYPCNDSTYFWHIVSISKKDLNEENRFVGQIMSSLLGVNTTYDESINTFAFGDYHFIVDIDNKKVFLKESNNADKKEIENLTNLRSYFQNIIKEKEKNSDSIFLKQYIEQLKKDLENILTKEEQGNPKIKKDICFFDNPGEKEKNKLIQECFYNFILNLLMYFYQKINIDITLNKIKIKEKVKEINKREEEEEEKALNEQEEYFCELFKSTSKYKIYFENFIQNSDAHESLKIPLIFSEEFINIKIRSNKKQIPLKLSFLNIIDNLYKNSENNTIKISVNNFYFQYLEDKLKNYFNEYNSEYKEHNINSNDKKLFCLNKNIIHKYVYLLNNLYEKNKLKELFPSIKIKKESIHLIDKKIICQTIQNALEKNDLIKTSNYLLYALIYMFSILMPLYSYRDVLFYIDKLLPCLKQIDFFSRFYIYIIIQTLYKYYLINIEKNKFPDMKYNNIKIYIYLFLSHLKEQNILPNEEIYLIENKFSGKNIFNIRTSYRQKNNNLIIEEIDNKYEEELDLKDKNIFQIFMKYNFGFKGYFKPKLIIKSLMKEKGDFNVAFKDEFNKNGNNDKKRKTPLVIIKIKEDIYRSELYSPKKIFKVAQIIYKEFINNNNLDIKNINIKILRELLINLIQYSIELNDLNIPYEFLVNGLYMIRNLNNKNKIDNKDY